MQTAVVAQGIIFVNVYLVIVEVTVKLRRVILYALMAIALPLMFARTYLRFLIKFSFTSWIYFCHLDVSPDTVEQFAQLPSSHRTASMERVLHQIIACKIFSLVYQISSFAFADVKQAGRARHVALVSFTFYPY